MINRIARYIGRETAMRDINRALMNAVIGGDSNLALTLAELQLVHAENMHRFLLSERDIVHKSLEGRGALYNTLLAPIRAVVADFNVAVAQGYLDGTRQNSSTFRSALRRGRE